MPKGYIILKLTFDDPVHKAMYKHGFKPKKPDVFKVEYAPGFGGYGTNGVPLILSFVVKKKTRELRKAEKNPLVYYDMIWI